MSSDDAKGSRSAMSEDADTIDRPLPSTVRLDIEGITTRPMEETIGTIEGRRRWAWPREEMCRLLYIARGIAPEQNTRRPNMFCQVYLFDCITGKEKKIKRKWI